MSSNNKTRSCIQKKAIIIPLNPKEKEFIQSLKKEDLEKIVNVFNNEANKCDDKPLRIQILTSNLPDRVKMKYFNSIPFNESDKYITLVKASLDIPINQYNQNYNKKKTKKFLENAIDIMGKSITGHEEAKREVLKLLCQWKTGDGFGTNYAIGLEGKPGTGKTTFVKKAFARALDLPMVFISLGGCTDASYLLGNVYTYEGATYGRLVSGLIESKCSNPIFYFDELDKISTSYKGDEIVNTLIHLIDPAQNSHIRDKYFSFDVDFSKCIFIFSYNDPNKVSPILLDRIKRIQLASPTNDEKMLIMTNHIIPRTKEKIKIKQTMDEESLKYIITRNNDSHGMRSIEKDIDHVMSCANLSTQYGSTSVLGIDKEYKVSKDIPIEFTKDVLFEKEDKSKSCINMMYM